LAFSLPKEERRTRSGKRRMKVFAHEKERKQRVKERSEGERDNTSNFP